MPKFINLIGRQFGKLKVVEYIRKDKWGDSLWLCECDCNNILIILGNNLKRSSTKSCGCLRKERMTKHGCWNNITYKSWHQMKQRCINHNNPKYKDYGGRGITVCKRWMKFENFLEDMKEKQRGYQIERIDNNNGYYKENCKWATRKEQQRNRRNNRLITYKRKTKCIAEWAEKTGISYEIIWWRLNHGWSVKGILTATKQKP